MKNFDLIVYLGGDWLGYHRRQMLLALAARIGEGGKILCVERPVCPFTTPVLHPKKFREWLAGKRGIRKVTNNLFIYTPYYLVHDQIASRVPGIVVVNRALLSRLLKNVIRKISFEERTLLSWIYNPFQTDYIGLVGEIGYIYECLDNYPELMRGSFSKVKIEQMEEALVKKAKIVFTTALKLYNTQKTMSPNTFYIPNGVNLSLFQHFCENDQIPDDLKSIPEPRFGFVGRLDEAFIDCELIETVAVSNPTWSFIFIGPVNTTLQTKRLQSLPNIFFLGIKTYELLPLYLKPLDAGLIPLKINKITECLNPLKLYEYMAAGCPIVSTDVPEIRPYAGFVRVARSIDEFTNALRSVLNNDSFQLRQSLREEAKQHSWEVRVKEMIRIIQNAI
ncbi:MAG: glycosyltransferase [Proteobacteria bacterium]|nr:glycosyltransferase [Pseudomonadota bacterium]